MSNVFWSGLDAALNSKVLIIGVILMTAIGIWGGPAGDDVRAALSARGAVMATTNVLHVSNDFNTGSVATTDFVYSVSP